VRVKVTYSVELEDVPLKVSSLLANISNEIKNSCELISDSSNLLSIENNSLKSIKDIEAAQNLIIGNLEQLDDVRNILIGYQKILLEPPEDNHPHENTIDPSAQESLEQINSLAEQLKVLQNTTGDN
tara:strand:- start:3299 stop:3679 length:381 start_codon:yes stop_codon:yes gene_type:complete